MSQATWGVLVKKVLFLPTLALSLATVFPRYPGRPKSREFVRDSEEPGGTVPIGSNLMYHKSSEAFLRASPLVGSLWYTGIIRVRLKNTVWSSFFFPPCPHRWASPALSLTGYRCQILVEITNLARAGAQERPSDTVVAVVCGQNIHCFSFFFFRFLAHSIPPGGPFLRICLWICL